MLRKQANNMTGRKVRHLELLSHEEKFLLVRNANRVVFRTKT
jgi:hypothetical protein